MTSPDDVPPVFPRPVREYRRPRGGGGGIAIVLGIGVGIPVVAVVAGVVLLVSLFGAVKPNTAEVQAQPILTALQHTGATVICDDGDPGYGPDNTQPWYIAYVEVPHPDAGRRALVKAAAAHGLRLVPHAGSRVTDPDFDLASASDVPADPAARRARLDVRSSTDAAVELDCGGVRWGTSRMPKAGEAIYEVGVEEPDNAL